jgi:hypothetical protein
LLGSQVIGSSVEAEPLIQPVTTNFPSNHQILAKTTLESHRTRSSLTNTSLPPIHQILPHTRILTYPSSYQHAYAYNLSANSSSYYPPSVIQSDPSLMHRPAYPWLPFHEQALHRHNTLGYSETNHPSFYHSTCILPPILTSTVSGSSHVLASHQSLPLTESLLVTSTAEKNSLLSTSSTNATTKTL